MAAPNRGKEGYPWKTNIDYTEREGTTQTVFVVDSFRWDSNPIEDRRTILKNHYEKEVNLTSTYSDRRCELGIFQAALLLQDAMTELFHQYRCDAIRLSRRIRWFGLWRGRKSATTKKCSGWIISG